MRNVQFTSTVDKKYSRVGSQDLKTPVFFDLGHIMISPGSRCNFLTEIDENLIYESIGFAREQCSKPNLSDFENFAYRNKCKTALKLKRSNKRLTTLSISVIFCNKYTKKNNKICGL